MQSVLALVANRPPLTWSDADVERLPAAAAAIGQAFQEACMTGPRGTGVTSTYQQLNQTEKAEADYLVHQLQQNPLVRRTRSRKALIAALETMLGHLSRGEQLR